jgi:hypothetical protein
MRLTLRNMLAYMDDILEAEDAEQIRKKIEESKPATEQMHRIRDCMRRLRLGSPELTERGGGLDPNTVAEYLDHQLPSDRVADFEKVCLESDVHLAEVASCHQILALVLGEPAEVDPESRQRMYQLPEMLAAQAKAATEAATAESVAGPAEAALPAAAKEPSRRAKPAVPDYLRQAKASKGYFWARLAALTVALMVLAVIGGLVAGKHLGWTLAKQRLAQGPIDAGPEKSPSKSPAGTKTPGTAAEADKGALPAGEATPKPAVANAGSAGKAAASVANAKTSPAVAMAKPAPAAGPNDLAAAPGGNSGVGAETAPSPPETAPTPQPPPKPSGPDAQAGPLPGPNAVATAPAAPSLLPPPGGAAKKAGPLPVEPSAAMLDRVGSLISPREVLVKYSSETSSWMRVSKDSPLMPGDHCRSLPTYRPTISLGGEIRVRLVDNRGQDRNADPGPDGAMVVLLPVDPQQGLSGLAVDYGRMVIQPEGKTPARVRLQVGEHAGVLTLMDGVSSLAIQAVRAPIYKVDPEKEPGPLVVDFFATSGKVLWQETHAPEPVAMNAPVRLRLSDQPAEAAAVERFPDWIAADTGSMLEERASTTMEPELKPERSLALTLQELAEHRREEVRWLALRCLAEIGDFRLMVKSLGNVEKKRSWPSWPDAYIDQIQAGIRRSPRSAGEVRTAMETLYGKEGASLYDMLWRHNAPGEKERTLSSADAERLVHFLENKDLAFRVLAFWNLKNLAKVGLNYNYKPDDPENKRRLAAQKWRDHFRQIVAGKPPEETPVAPLPPDESPKPVDRPASE